MKIYFASDLHLGIPDEASSAEREKRFVRWLDQVAVDADEIFILGDLFDFWFEYARVVPKGFARVLGKLATICDLGIPVHFFTGNHDLWSFGYLEEQIGMQVHRKYQRRTIAGKHFLIGHGDGLGPRDKSYKLMKKVFSSRFFQWLFRWLHPDIGVAIAQFWSNRSRGDEIKKEVIFHGEEEWLVQFSRRKLEKEHIDFFIFGHRHLPIELELGGDSKYINLGDWISHFSYAVFDGTETRLEWFD